VAKLTRDDVLKTLNHLEWKSKIKVWEELTAPLIEGEKRAYRHYFSLNFVDATLERLVEDGLAERRPGTDPVMLKRRKGVGYPEYKLTEDGIQQKIDATERKPTGVFGAILQPDARTAIALPKQRLPRLRNRLKLIKEAVNEQ